MREIVLLGDSIAKGVVRRDAKDRYHLSQYSFARNCEENLDVHITNLAHMGSTINNGLASFACAQSAIEASDEVWTLFGGNDSNVDWFRIADGTYMGYKPATPLEEFHEKYVELIQKTQAKNKQMTMFSLPPVAAYKFTQNVIRNIQTQGAVKNWMKFICNNPSTITNLHEAYNLEIFKLGYQYHIPVIDLTTPFLKEKNYEPYFCDDGMHPNDEGHFLISQAIKKARPDLARPASSEQQIFLKLARDSR